MFCRIYQNFYTSYFFIFQIFEILPNQTCFYALFRAEYLYFPFINFLSQRIFKSWSKTIPNNIVLPSSFCFAIYLNPVFYLNSYDPVFLPSNLPGSFFHVFCFHRTFRSIVVSCIADTVEEWTSEWERKSTNRCNPVPFCWKPVESDVFIRSSLCRDMSIVMKLQTENEDKPDRCKKRQRESGRLERNIEWPLENGK